MLVQTNLIHVFLLCTAGMAEVVEVEGIEDKRETVAAGVAAVLAVPGS